MRGARGLLISITGGDDLTLYEVDEAATRIREEVDPEANIILGATFDGSLDGFIRVSVVATGIDRQAFEEIGNHTKFQNAIVSEINSKALPVGVPSSHAEQFEDEADGSFELPTVKASEGHANTTPTMTAGAEPAPASEEKPTPTPELAVENDQASQPEISVLAAAVAEQKMAITQPRMPSIEEFPPLAVKEYREKGADASSQGAPQVGKRPSLFEKLVNAGLGKKTPEPRYPRAKSEPAFVSPASASNQSFQKTATQSPPPRQPGVATVQPVSEHQGEAEFDADQLEIPAFLRRQAN